MAKRTKPKSETATRESTERAIVSPTVSSTAAVAAPAKQPSLLAVSVILFALWFVFLLVTAMVG